MKKLELIEKLKKLEAEVESETECLARSEDCEIKTDQDNKFWLEAADMIHSNLCDILDLYKLY